MILFILSCTKEPPKDESEFIEFLKVQGLCFENHVQMTAEYEGSFVHWYNKKDDSHSRYGSVMHTTAVEDIVEKIQNKNKYYPPFLITFWDIPPDKFSQSKMILNGISRHISNTESEEGPQYEAIRTENVVNIPDA